MHKGSQAVFTDSEKISDLSGWAGAIAEAERQIAEHENRVKKLRLAISTFQEMGQRGEPIIPYIKTESRAA